MTTWSKTRSLAVVLLVAVGLSGCVAFGGVDRTTGTIDRSVGAARNNSILLNIVRASRHEPLYFYSISRVSGNSLEDFKLSLPALSFGPGRVASQRNFTFGANGLDVLDSQSSGSFDVALLESRNFYQGMLAPLDLVEVDLLLRQGFPRELVYRLVVQDITVYNGKTLQRFVNDPTSPGYGVFEAFFKTALKDGITTEVFATPDAGGDPKKASGSDASSTVASSPHMTPSARLCWDPALANLADKTVASDLSGSNNECGIRPPGDAVAFATTPPGLKQTFEQCATPGGASGSTANNRVCVKYMGANIAVQLNTRSLFSIFQYLGKLLNDEGTAGAAKSVELLDLGAPVEARRSGPLMLIKKGRLDNCFAAIAWEGRYCLPKEGGDNLKLTFSIINALQALKTAPGDLPVTTPVRIEQ
jgi:hypothetical protein